MVGGGGGIGPSLYPPSSPSSLGRNNGNGSSAHAEQPRLRGAPGLYIPLLALGTLGVQLVWSTEMVFASPYLLELGLSKASMAAVFVAGPLSGLIVQPIVGATSDKCTHRWGRRRPYLAVAVALCAASLLLLGYARSLSHTVLLSGNPTSADKLTISLAVLSIFCIDFSVNAVMSVDRALILDVLPASQQALGNAWALRLTSTGLLLGFLIGNLDLPHTFPFSWLSFIWHTAYTEGAPPSEAQIKCMSVTTMALLLITQALTAYAAVEQVYTLPPDGDARAGVKSSRLQSTVQAVLAPLQELRKTAAALSDSIWTVFKVQYFTWIAMYPLLFWGTTWIGSIYRQQASQDTGSPDEIAERGTRLGSLAMFYQSLFALLISVVIPLLLPSTSSTLTDARPRIPLLNLPLPVWNVSLPALWALSHFCYAISMLFTWPAVWWASTTVAVLIIAATGFSVAAVNWIPFSLLGILVHEAEHGSDRAVGSEAEGLLNGGQGSSQDRRDSSQGSTRTRPAMASRGGDGDQEDDDDLDALSFGADRDIEEARNQRLRAERGGGAGTHAGAVLGLHNVSIVAGQLTVTAVSTLVFAFMDAPAPVVPHPPPVTPNPPPNSGAPPPRAFGFRERAAGAAQPDAIGVILRLGMFSAIVAGILALRLRTRMASSSAGV